MRAFAMVVLLDGDVWLLVQSVAAFRELNYPMVVVAEVKAVALKEPLFSQIKLRSSLGNARFTNPIQWRSAK
jgi:hypothetical protein